MSASALMVIDASVAMKWLRDEENSDWARALPATGSSLLAPDLLLAECGNILWRLGRKSKIEPAAEQTLFSQLLTVPLSIVPAGPDLSRAALALSRSAALATADTRFARAIRRAEILPALLILTPPAPASA